jgi:hypothetical protein
MQSGAGPSRPTSILRSFAAGRKDSKQLLDKSTPGDEYLAPIRFAVKKYIDRPSKAAEDPSPTWSNE